MSAQNFTLKHFIFGKKKFLTSDMTSTVTYKNEWWLYGHSM